MSNTPLTANDQGKLILFFLLMLPAVGFGIGVMPAIFLIFGIYMTKKNSDFAHIQTAVRFFWGYLAVALALCLAGGMYGYNQWQECMVTNSSCYSGRGEDNMTVSAIFAAVAFFYLFASLWLFSGPLVRHRHWVAANGIFTNKPKPTPTGTATSEINIMGGERLKTFSVADELMKWAQLKSDGHVTEEEFQEARKKLLQRN